MKSARRKWIAGLVGLFLACASGRAGARAPQSVGPVPGCGIALRLLVVSADGKESVLPAIRQTLDYLGTPYDLFVAVDRPPLAAANLTSGCVGRYQGVILTTGELGYTPAGGGFQSAFGPEEFTTLDAYESLYGARRVVWYAYPTPALGWQWPSFPGGAVDTSAQPLAASFTPQAASVFTHVNRRNALTITNANAYLAPPFDAGTTPLLVDGRGNALAAVRTQPDGRETLALTFDGNPHLTHSLVLAYDLVNWVTRGIFLGERHAYLSPQVDDLFLHNTMWTAATPCGTPVDSTTDTYRITGADYAAAVTWQRSLQFGTLPRNVRLTMAFNGWGANQTYRPDTLTAVVKKYVKDFHFVSHTWDHENLDPATASDATIEVLLNNAMATRLKLGADSRALVTPNVSGLRNADVMKALYATGVRYVVTDTSQPGYGNPTPNTGLWNQYQPKLFMIPRYPTNLFFNVSTPEEWAAEYNCMYNAFWHRNLSYEEILGNISDTLVTYLLKGDLNPLMFHQPNLRAYDGQRSLLGDLLNMTIDKYSRLVNFPVLSPTMAAVGDKMIARAKYNEAGVSAVLIPGRGLVITAANAAVVPITGLNIAGAESYAGQWIAYVTTTAGKSKTIAIPVAVR
jgi:hypothetical protein